MEIQNIINIVVSAVGVAAPLLVGILAAKVRSDFAAFELRLLKELNGRYVWRHEYDQTLRRIDRLEGITEQ